MGASSTSWQPPPGLIFDIAEAAGIEIKVRRAKTPIRCPFHEDRTESAFLSDSNVFFCSCCTPGKGWTAKRFAEALGVDWRTHALVDFVCREVRQSSLPPPPAFGAADAALVWQALVARASDPTSRQHDREVWEYLDRRGLTGASAHGAFGIVAVDMTLPSAVSNWARTGHRLVVPLFDPLGVIANVQARTIRDNKPKTLFPAGSRASGTLFACPRGLELLRGTASAARRVLYAEGLTDHLALTVASPVPVLSAPGTSMAVAGIGSWVQGRELCVALDGDAAGDAALNAVAKRAYAQDALRVRRVDWPHGAKDACQVIELDGPEGLRQFLDRVLGEVSQ